ncbi:MAG TPA: prolipoprotein diacylglyceryl transferase [Actinocatenispora sp.]
MNLASLPSPSTGVLQLGPLPLRAYAVCIVIGIVLACVITERRLRARGAPPWTVLDIAVWAVPFGIVGARIYHVITDPELYFADGKDWFGIFEIWRGGLGIWGAVAGGALGAWVACRRRGIPLSMVADALAPGLPVAQAVGRWGNWFNQELYGRPSTLPWAVEIDPAHRLVGYEQFATYHPTFLYECVWDLLVALAVWLLDRKFRFGRGRAFALYVMLYVFGRFFTELVRIDHANAFLGLRVNDWVSILVFLGALAFFVLVRGPRMDLVADADGALSVVPEGTGAAVAGSTGAEETEVESDDEPDPDDPDGSAGEPDDPSGEQDTDEDPAADPDRPKHTGT